MCRTGESAVTLYARGALDFGQWGCTWIDLHKMEGQLCASARYIPIPSASHYVSLTVWEKPWRGQSVELLCLVAVAHSV